MVIKSLDIWNDNNNTVVETAIYRIGSRFHWVRQTITLGISVVEHGFSSTLLKAIFESEI